MMKYIFQALLCLCFTLLVAASGHAQTEKGRLMVGGNLSNLSLRLNENTRNLSFNVQGSAGKFVANNLVLGTRLGLGHGSYRYRPTGVNASGWTVSPGIFGRYYVPIGKRIRPFVELETGVSQSFGQVNGDAYRTTALYGQASAGASFFVGDRMSLDLSLGYRLHQMLNNPYGRVGPFGNLQANVGFNHYLPSGKR